MQRDISSEDKHLKKIAKKFDDFRQIGDEKADAVVHHLVTSGKSSELYRFLKARSMQDLESIHIEDQFFKAFIETEIKLPDWAGKSKMENATALFRGNGNEFLFMLGIVSLPYCYAAANGAKALYHTEKIRKNTEKRLLDTTSFIIEIMKEDAFDSGGNGFLVTKQVRLRHALARFHLKNVPEIQKLQEVPLNQEDMAGTNLAFSYVALKAMPLIGVQISKETQNNYLHFWAVIGFLLGLNRDLLTMDLKSAYQMERRIANRQFKPSFEGMALSEKLVSHYKEQIPNKMTIVLIKPLMRYLLGEEVAKMIGLSGRRTLNPLDKIMILLPMFKKYIFPPVQSFEFIAEQINIRQKQFEGQ